MKKHLYSSINNLMVAFVFITATKVAEFNLLSGIFAWTLAFACLDYHSYIDKKLNYPNNLFIKHY